VVLNKTLYLQSFVVMYSANKTPEFSILCVLVQGRIPFMPVLQQAGCCSWLPFPHPIFPAGSYTQTNVAYGIVTQETKERMRTIVTQISDVFSVHPSFHSQLWSLRMGNLLLRVNAYKILSCFQCGPLSWHSLFL
jgi:hypothetical protein